MEYVVNGLMLLGQITILIVFFINYKKRDIMPQGYRVVAINSMSALFIWLTSIFILETQTMISITFKTILAITYLTLTYFSLTMSKRLEKERTILERIEFEKKKAKIAEEESALIRDAELIIGDLFKNYKDSEELNFYNLIQMLMFKNTEDLPRKMLTNKEIHEELDILHPILEAIHPIASTLKGAVNLKKYNESKDINNVVLDFFTNPEVSEHFGLPISTNYPENPLLRLFRGSSKGFKGEDRLDKQLHENFKNKPLFTNLHLTDGNEKIELDALLIIGNNVITFEGKHYSADKIVFEKNGQAKIYKSGKFQIIDVVSQMNRHHNVIQNILGENVNVYSLFVLTDKKTDLHSSFENKYFKATYIDSIGFVVKDLELSKNDESEEIIFNLIQNAKIEERKFDSVNLGLIRQELIRLTSDKELNTFDAEKFAKTLKYSSLNKAENNVYRIEENLKIYKELYAKIKEML